PECNRGLRGTCILRAMRLHGSASDCSCPRISCVVQRPRNAPSVSRKGDGSLAPYRSPSSRLVSLHLPCPAALVLARPCSRPVTSGQGVACISEQPMAEAVGRGHYLTAYSMQRTMPWSRLHDVVGLCRVHAR